MSIKKYLIFLMVVIVAFYYIHTHETSFVLDELGNEMLSKLNENEIVELQPWAYHFQGKDMYETIWNIIFWQEDNIGYDYRKMFSYSNYIQSPTETYQKHSGVCIDYTLLTACLLLGLHNDAYIFVIDSKNPNSGGHAFCAVNVSGKFYAIDQNAPITDVDNHIKNFIIEHPDLTASKIRVYHFYIPKDKIYEVHADMFRWQYHPINKKLTLEEKKKIEEDIINYFSKKYNLIPNPKINNMEKMEYLPQGFKKGTYVYQPYECNLHPEFEEQYARWLDRRLSGHLTLTEKYKNEKLEKINFESWKYIWVKVEDNGGSGRIYTYLAN
ncbi:transglutaminase-like domain-containing protein [Methanothermococcus sp.]|uniref:transglutaminase-like domain-containing protein n=1 Tax=Methanothermococcus sp. TaxID=2614238 RepID=UPI0025EC27B9|nr:transglutaminase-like domain-containing protein [Methanothermococcus sp.]